MLLRSAQQSILIVSILFNCVLSFSDVVTSRALPSSSSDIGGEASNTIDNDDNNNNLTSTSVGQALDFDCPDKTSSNDTNEQVDCNVLVKSLRAPALAITGQELCCTLLSSPSMKSLCCDQIREICADQNAQDCPKVRRRIKPPKISSINRNRPIGDQPETTQSVSSFKLPALPSAGSRAQSRKLYGKQNWMAYYKLKKQKPSIFRR